MTKKMTPPIWDCRQARTEIALQAGGDGDEGASAHLLEAHLTQCAVCRQYRVRMKFSLDALQESVVQADPAVSPRSLWPGIAARLPAVIRPSAAARFNVWVPTGAMMAACAAMMLVTIVELERVIPLESTLTPQLRMVLDGDRRELPRVSPEGLRMVKGPAAARGAVPIRFDPVPRSELSAPDRDW